MNGDPLIPPSHREKDATAASEGRLAASVLRTAGQRRINMLWELTQSFIAIAVTSATLAVAAMLVQRAGVEQASAVSMLSNAFFLVIGFYFGRTNHERIGGIGHGEFTDPGERR